MKLLLENWREYLNEGIDPRIQKQIDRLLALPDIGVAMRETDRWVAFQYRVLPGREDRGDLPFGSVSIVKAKKTQTGPCLEGYVVLATGTEPGWGPLLYELALEWASRNGAGLTPDRDSVSHHARAVWDKYAKRSDVDKKQLDIDHKLGGDRDWLKRFKQLTPNYKLDDCDQTMALNYGGDDEWMDTSLAKMYYKETSEVTAALEEAGRLFIL